MCTKRLRISFVGRIIDKSAILFIRTGPRIKICTCVILCVCTAHVIFNDDRVREFTASYIKIDFKNCQSSNDGFITNERQRKTHKSRDDNVQSGNSMPNQTEKNGSEKIRYLIICVSIALPLALIFVSSKKNYTKMILST